MDWSKVLEIFEKLPSELQLVVGLIEAVQATKNGAHEAAQVHLDSVKEYIMNQDVVKEYIMNKEDNVVKEHVG